ncbi:MAG: redoxin domain-containing protein [Bacteroidales bacterium]|jgi:thioredoxin-related protein|nr:redoxin domain-containing protein [Bacteroidales bacterium]
MKYLSVIAFVCIFVTDIAFAQTNTKCRVGDVASDFTFVNNKGKEVYMSDVNAQYTILFFYSPDCEHCQKYIKQLKKDDILASFVSDSIIAFIAVAIETTEEEFGNVFFDLPIDWIKGYCEDCEEIIEHYLMKTPALFVLDDIKTVIKSDIEPKELKNFLINVIEEEK